MPIYQCPKCGTKAEIVTSKRLVRIIIPKPVFRFPAPDCPDCPLNKPLDQIDFTKLAEVS